MCLKGIVNPLSSSMHDFQLHLLGVGDSSADSNSKLGSAGLGCHVSRVSFALNELGVDGSYEGGIGCMAQSAPGGEVRQPCGCVGHRLRALNPGFQESLHLHHHLTFTPYDNFQDQVSHTVSKWRCSYGCAPSWRYWFIKVFESADIVCQVADRLRFTLAG